ncbi:coiled-coil domain-containing protein 30 isoform X1 [Xyrichtys novacula]|nr:coiled-coil domain-containing protein 30 isoform X1 [Xyrichtys novacula]
MAHNEIRRLTDELESSHLTQRAYEPELQAAQQEVEQLRQEVEKLKKYELVELRKTKELNDRLDLEIRALRNRVRSLDAEKNIQQQTVVSLQREVERLQSDLKGQQQLLTVHTEDNQDSELTKSQAAELVLVNQTCVNLQKELDARTACLMEKEETVTYLQKNVKKLQSALQEQQWQAEQKLLTAQAQASQVNELVQSQTIELNQSKEICKSLQNNLSAQSRCLLEKESEIHTLKQQLDDSHIKMDNIIATVCQKTKYLEDKSLETPKEADTCDNENNLENSFVTEDSLAQIPQLVHKENKTPMDFPEFREAVTNLMATQEECERLKKEICELLECLDKERSKYHEMKEKHKNKLLRAKQKLDDETTWRDEKIKSQERELSLCSHSLAKEKELTISITMENDKLLLERRRLLQQLNEEEHNKKDCHLTASLSKCRVDFLEIENRKLGNKLLHMSSQLAILERRSQNTQALHLTEELIKTSSPVQDFKCLHVHPQSPNEMKSEPSKSQGLYESAQSKQSDATSPPLQCFLSRSLSRSAEMGYLNLTSAQSRSDLSASLAGFSSSNSTFS